MKGYRVFKALGDLIFVEWTIRVSGKLVIDLTGADLSNAKLNNAKLNEAELNGAKLNWAELNGAELNGAKLNGAELNGAKLNGAKLNGAELNWAELNGAELNGADMDFSSWPLWCGSVGVKVGDRIAAQLIWHVAKLDTENCSPMMRDAIEHIRSMAAADVFSDEYRTELSGHAEGKTC